MALPHEIIEFLDGLIGGGGVQVAVCPKGGLHVLMSQPLRHQEDGDAVVDEQRGVAMSKLVEAENEAIRVEVENGT